MRVGLLKIKGQLNAVECDIANEAAVAQAFTWVEKTFGGVDLLVNNGGVFTKALLTDENNSKEIKNIIDSELMGKTEKNFQVKYFHCFVNVSMF